MGPQTVWTFLLEYSVVQGVLLAIIISVKSRQHYLSLLLITVSMLVFHFLYERFAWFEELPHFLWTNVPFWFMVGPFFFLYGLSTFRQERTFKIKDLVHFIPAALIIVLFRDFYFFTTGAGKIEVYKAMFGQDYNFDYFQLAYIIQILAYGFLSIRLSKRELGRLRQQESDSSVIHFGFLKKINLGFILYAGSALALALILLLFQDLYNSLLRYYSFVFLALASIVQISSYHFLVYSLPRKTRSVAPSPSKPTGKYASSALKEPELRKLLDQLKERIENQEDFKNPNLRISDLATDLGVPSHHISQCLNQELGKNFFDFINEYRVEAVKNNLTDPKYKNYTLFAIASEVGFNSHSSFYRIFKKTTGMTPKAYIDSTQSSQ